MKRLDVGLFGLVFACATVAPSNGLQAAVVESSWIGASGGNWHTAANWSPEAVPNNGADTYNVTFTSGSGTLIAVLNAAGPTFTTTVNNFTLGALFDPPSNIARVDALTGPPPQTLRVLGTFTWNSGTLGGSGGGSYQLMGGGALATSASVTLGGNLIISGNSTFTQAGGTISGGSIQVQSGSTWQMSAGIAPGINNSGTLRVPALAGNMSFSSINNTGGTVDVEGGTLTVANSAFSQSGASAITILDGGSIKSPLAQINGGTVRGVGTFDTSNGGLTLGGFNLGVTGTATLAPGRALPASPIGMISLPRLTNGPSAIFEMEIGGLTPGVHYDQVSVTGPAPVALDGTINLSLINGFESTATTGNSFNLITAPGGFVGTFDNLADDSTVVVSGVAFNADYTATALVLTVVPEPRETALAVGSCLLLFAWARRRCPSRKTSAERRG